MEKCEYKRDAIDELLESYHIWMRSSPATPISRSFHGLVCGDNNVSVDIYVSRGYKLVGKTYIPSEGVLVGLKRGMGYQLRIVPGKGSGYHDYLDLEEFLMELF